MIKAYAAMNAGAPLEAFEYDPGLLANDEVEIAVESCGISACLTTTGASLNTLLYRVTK